MSKRKSQSIKFAVITDRIAVELDDAEEITKGGIVIPDQAKDQNTTQGAVVAVGPGPFIPMIGKRLAPSVAVGSRVVFERYCGNRLEIDGKFYRVMKEQDIIAVVPPKDVATAEVGV